MILVVGLGNPGRQYEETRHNIGFRVVDELARRAREPVVWREKFSAESAISEVGRRRALLLKPQTYMNRSGHSVRPAAAFYKVAAEDILVVHDELDVAFGQLRLKSGGGAAGHNGLRSVTEQLGTPDYVRLRFGIGRPPPDFRGSGADFVLQAFAPEELAELDTLVSRAAESCTLVARDGLPAAMNVVNRKR